MRSCKDYQANFKQGKYRLAERHAKMVLELGEKLFGSQHKNVAAFLNNLALIYRIQGRFGEAEELYKRDLVISQAVLGRAHPSVARSLNNLADLYVGARALLVSRWYVNSNPAVALTTGAVTAMQKNSSIGKAQALQSSMLALINKGGAFAHPSYWAPFEVAGEGGAGR